jgi:hypothetical protein
MERVYGELRFVPYAGLIVRPSIGMRIGRLRASSNIPIDWSWHLEIPAGVRLEKWPQPELYVAVGQVVFPDDTFAYTFRVGLSFAPFGT